MTQTVDTQTLESDFNFLDCRVYLEVPFAEKDRAKEFGARWDPSKVQWYAPPDTDLSPLREWMQKRIYLKCKDNRDREAVEDLGARYDRATGLYYILDTMNTSDFNPWIM